MKTCTVMQPQNRFLVTGATGDTGGYTVEQMVERGHAVRALAHREDDRSKRLEKMGAEVVIGDLVKFNDVCAAMRGVRGAYFCYSASRKTTIDVRNFIVPQASIRGLNMFAQPQAAVIDA